MTLGFPLLAEDARQITFAAGSTRLTFVQDENFTGFYHVAFDIPRNCVAQARAWVQERVPLLSGEHGTDQFESKDWNSTNLYFDDPAGNILEFMARHDLNHDADQFTGVLHVSELGVVPDVLATAQNIGQRYDLHPFNGESDTFTAVGGHDGMLIVVKEGRGWFPVGRSAIPAPFRLVFTSATTEGVISHDPAS